MSSNKEHNGPLDDEAISAVPLDKRQHWMSPAIVFGGLEFTIPVLMVGGALAVAFNLETILLILVIALVIQWVGNTVNGYMGAKTGRASSVIARASFGTTQARVLIGTLIFVVSLGWWAIQTAVAGEAIAAMLGIDYETEWWKWAAITVVIGLIFAVPSVLGFTSMKWTDYLAMPAGLLLIVTGVYLAIDTSGIDGLFVWEGDGSMTVIGGITLVIGVNVSQWLIAADYTRYAKPRLSDNIKIPLGIVAVGFPLFVVGAVMAISVGEADIVQVMVGLGFAFWGFITLWLATWTSQLVNNYTMGLALANMLNINSAKGRSWLTLGGTIIALVIALAGFLDYFTSFLISSSLLYTAVAGVMFSDFFFVRKQSFDNNRGWNWVATISALVGLVFGAFTQYVWPMGIPPVQTLIISGIVYLIASRIKARYAPCMFCAPETFRRSDTATPARRPDTV
ncbi:cytosine permease [Brevibacterium casei]|uniref:Cytosine/purines uracil thiamine allantoin permease n=1 Tax=Brevibacterium casei S18 TaxID=1229781 RepID=K9AYB5_9MICO|nr:cytosine permease [Brevibacterium casei]EKU47557.1 cytosine/purines uracil thiamine allantoin permease [Brevibacterium casei S18]